MTDPKFCSKGWGARCSVAQGKRCRCKCGGENHGNLIANVYPVQPLPNRTQQEAYDEDERNVQVRPWGYT